MSGRIPVVKVGVHAAVFNGTLTVTTLVTGVAVTPTIDKLSETL
jgi:hypothetical protein